MASALPKRTRRLAFRLQAEQKALIVRAAAVQGRTVTSFAMDALVQAARQAVEHAAMTRLSARDRDLFLAILDRDTRPNAALKQAARRYKTRG